MSTTSRLAPDAGDGGLVSVCMARHISSALKVFLGHACRADHKRHNCRRRCFEHGVDLQNDSERPWTCGEMQDFSPISGVGVDVA